MINITHIEQQMIKFFKYFSYDRLIQVIFNAIHATMHDLQNLPTF